VAAAARQSAGPRGAGATDLGNLRTTWN
jgi:hypothetical protein